MPTHLVNLDALIKREDFTLEERDIPPSYDNLREIRVEDFEQGRGYPKILRKPDFQRETANWTPDKIADFIQSVVNRDFIPSVIMWESKHSSKVFVIDGAHRLSAIMAWVHDDYGDGTISKEFFRDSIPPEQRKLGDKTRELVVSRVGSYRDLKKLLDENTTPAELLHRARRSVMSKVPVQWVIASASVAEESFRKINGNSTPIDTTEASIIQARRKPNAIATRALMHAGTGHKYWGNFPESAQVDIEDLAKDTYELLFNPILENPIKTLDLPIGGAGYSSAGFRMIFDLVNRVNGIKPSMWQEGAKKNNKNTGDTKILKDDEDGQSTIRFLKRVHTAAELISGHYAGSLGLHPAVYFYSSNGNFQPSAFLAVITFMEDLRDKRKLKQFTRIREPFEEFLVCHRHFINDTVQRKGSRDRPLESLIFMYETIFGEMLAGNLDRDVIVAKLKSDGRLEFLKDVSDNASYRRRFSKNAISEAYLKEALERPLPCCVCHARLHRNSISGDHKIRQQDGGDGNPANAGLSHFYCNTGYKESEHAKGIRDTKAGATES